MFVYLQAVFRKILTSAKNKMKAPNIKFDADGPGVSGHMQEDAEEVRPSD